MNRINLEGKTILITGAAGFIGASLAYRLLQQEKEIRIIGVDNLNNYYDPALKTARLEKLKDERFAFIKADIAGPDLLDDLFEQYHPHVIIHLAAQAGVRWSIDHPDDYIHSNIIGFFRILEACRHFLPEHLVYASSSSVYGDSDVYPLKEEMNTDHPASLYAATKKSGEILAESYAELYRIPATGLRFFTVYGPWGRPDMAYFSFADRLSHGKTIKLFNYGNCERDFTYIDDIIEGIYRVISCPPTAGVPHRILNIGKGHPDNLMDFVTILVEELMKAGVLPKSFDPGSHTVYLPKQMGDVGVTYADTAQLEALTGYHPETDLRTGLAEFCQWYAEYIWKENNRKSI